MSIFSPLEQFNIVSIIPISIGNFDISFTNSSVIALIVTFVLVCLMSFVTFKSTLVPTRWQSVTEILYEFVLSLLVENIGEKGVKYFPIMFTTFMFIFSCNIIGMVPYSFTVTSHLIVTFGLAMALFLGINIIGVRTHGFHFLSLFLPAGAPLAMSPFLVLIELVSYFFRVISLAVRLFANMMAGHTLLKILAGFAWTMISVGGILYVVHLVPLLVIFAIVGLEFAIAFLQAYVFTVLSCIYLNDAINLH